MPPATTVPARSRTTPGTPGARATTRGGCRELDRKVRNVVARSTAIPASKQGPRRSWLATSQAVMRALKIRSGRYIR